MTGRYRKKAREIALKTLYAFDIREKKDDIFEILEFVIKDIKKDLSENTLQYAYSLVDGINNHIEEIDEIIKKYLKDWKLERLGSIEKALIRLGTYELLFTDIEDKGRVFVDILDLGNCYSLTKEANKFVNGILSAIYKNEPQKVNNNEQT